MTKEAKNIMFKLLCCDTIQELVNCWDQFKGVVSGDPDKNKLIEVKEVMKEYFTLPEFKYKSAFSNEDVERINLELNLSLPEMKRHIALNIKKLKYYGRI